MVDDDGETCIACGQPSNGTKAVRVIPSSQEFAGNVILLKYLGEMRAMWGVRVLMRVIGRPGHHKPTLMVKCPFCMDGDVWMELHKINKQPMVATCPQNHRITAVENSEEVIGWR